MPYYASVTVTITLASISSLPIIVAFIVALPAATPVTIPLLSTFALDTVSEAKVISDGDTKNAAVPSLGIAKIFQAFVAPLVNEKSPPSIANAVTLSYQFLSNKISLISAYTGLFAVHPPFDFGV